jgi:thioredoxin 1
MTHMVQEEQIDTAVTDEALPRRRSFFSRFRRDAAAATPAPVIELDDESFFGALDGRPTIADFWAPWCQPCKTLHPLFDDLARSHSANGGVQFVRVDVDASPRVATELDIMSIPTLIVFDRSGREIEREIGVPGKRRLEHLARDARSAAARDETSDERGTR